jgi:uncharacterized membrane protein YgaE (UPF0421/DUF939 family)
MQPNIYRSIKTISEQATGNVIGALLAVIMIPATDFKPTLSGKNDAINKARIIAIPVFSIRAPSPTGNVIGALLAVIMVTIFGKNIVIMGVTVILLIAILYKLNLAHVATLASSQILSPL